ncbi:pyridoxamine 5'-phosphate oxidase family protein [Microlunatus parietis]|uniref:General stress protein 26 n=1 Tax=Microlunatus parietis TaxID=682979 RepID=A0A7Y9IC66_9ACTN|nr:pyridoxamine 5'-phosphate oxidase family protein [Microlunatus parietis]NYE73898.1 general stress protein 26 [Microlunatus parietis]
MTAPSEEHRRGTAPYPLLRDGAAEIIGDIGYATMTTVDRRGRPRSRVLIAVWELDREVPVGWLGTFPTPVKLAHLADNPHATFSYWSPRQDTVALDTVTRWDDSQATAERVWELYGRGSPPGSGYDPGRFWRGPDDPSFRVLRLDPWRIQVLRGRDLAAGRPPLIWRATPDRAGADR